MLKTLYIDNLQTGHHLSYLMGLIEDEQKNGTIILVPKKIQKLPSNVKQIICDYCNDSKRKLISYIRWIYKIRKIVKKEEPDIIVFLYGNYLLLYFGLGLGSLCKRQHTIITMHAIPVGTTAKIQARSTLRLFDKVITHSKAEREIFEKWGIKNVLNIEYPSFNQLFPSIEESKKYYSLSDERKTILALGGTRKSKGLDLLLSSLNKIDIPFQLLVAGKEEYFKKEYIRNNFKSKNGNLILAMKLLSDEEFAYAIAAADIVVLPYRKTYFGPSGPMGESVAFEKCIVGPSNGTIGELIEKYHLGYTFESENIESMKNAIRDALLYDFMPDEKYRIYKTMINISSFKSEYGRIIENIN